MLLLLLAFIVYFKYAFLLIIKRERKMIDYFLIIVALVWIIFASVSDLKKREVPNWLSFSLIAFAFAYSGFFALYNQDLWFFLSGLIGLIVFIGIGYGFYYVRVFAGGDAKLLMALGAVLPVSSSLILNLWISLAFIFLLLVSGSIYGIIWSSVLAARNREKFSLEFRKHLKKNKKIINLSFIAAILLLIMFFFAYIYYQEFASLFIFAMIMVILFPFLFTYAKSIEESCMIVFVETGKLTEGDWLYEKVKVGRKTIRPYWEGLSQEELKILRKKKGKVKIKQGIPFVPAFFFAFIALIYLLCFRHDIFNLFF